MHRDRGRAQAGTGPRVGGVNRDDYARLKHIVAGALSRPVADRQAYLIAQCGSDAATRLEAEQSKFEVGMSTNFFVVQAQRDLRDAQNTELRALADYRKSLVNLERAQEEPGGGGGGNFGGGNTGNVGGGGGGQ